MVDDSGRSFWAAPRCSTGNSDSEHSGLGALPGQSRHHHDSVKARRKAIHSEGRIVDSNNGLVREFIQTAVGKNVFVQSFSPFETGTYRLTVTITDKTGAVVKLDRFPPLTVPVR